MNPIIRNVSKICIKIENTLLAPDRIHSKGKEMKFV